MSRKRVRGDTGVFSARYPFSELEVGDQFIVNLFKDSPDFDKRYANIRSSAYMYSKRNPEVKFKCRRDDELGVIVERII